MSISAHRVASTFETGAFALAGGLAAAAAHGAARHEARVAAIQADQAEAATLDDLAVIGRQMAADRQELARLRAENAALKAQVAAYRADAVRTAAVAARRTNARRA